MLKAVPSRVEDEFVLVREAAAIAGRSTTWVRNRVFDGGLQAQRRAGEPTRVSLDDLRRLLAYRKRVASPLARAQHAPLRLVVDNT